MKKIESCEVSEVVMVVVVVEMVTMFECENIKKTARWYWTSVTCQKISKLLLHGIFASLIQRHLRDHSSLRCHKQFHN